MPPSLPQRGIQLRRRYDSYPYPGPGYYSSYQSKHSLTLKLCGMSCLSSGNHSVSVVYDVVDLVW
jgi:hypothetical protein